MTTNMLTKWWFHPDPVGWPYQRNRQLRGVRDTSARISNEDMRHLNAFSEAKKTVVMREIMSQAPAKTVTLSGRNDFEKTILKLRREGFGLIDVQPQETVCTTVWYRRKLALLRRPGAEVAMLLWEPRDHEETTTLVTWGLRLSLEE